MLSGCAGVHFYNAENDQTAAAAKEASDSLDLVGAINQERENQAKLLTHEIAVVSDFATTRRNTALRALLVDRKVDGEIEPLSDQLERHVEGRRKRLIGGANLKGVLGLNDDLIDARENLQAAMQDFKSGLAVGPPSCPASQKKGTVRAKF